MIFHDFSNVIFQLWNFFNELPFTLRLETKRWNNICTENYQLSSVRYFACPFGNEAKSVLQNENKIKVLYQ